MGPKSSDRSSYNRKKISGLRYRHNDKGEGLICYDSSKKLIQELNLCFSEVTNQEKNNDDAGTLGILHIQVPRPIGNPQKLGASNGTDFPSDFSRRNQTYDILVSDFWFIEQ